MALSPPPTVSVVMSVYNGEKYLREAVESVLKQTFTDFEFIIVNDGSTDRTRDILQSYSDPRIILMHQENAGLTKSLNRALARARGELIARQDADDLSLPDRLQTQVEFLAANPEVSLVGSAVQVIDGEGCELTIFRPPCDFTTIAQKLKSYNCFWHGSVLFRRSCLTVLGGYTEAFTTAQDYDFWLRFAEKYQLANLPLPLYAYRFNPDAVTFKRIVAQRRMAEMARRLAAAREKNLPERELLEEFDQYVKSPLTQAEKHDIVQSYKPWCRLLLNNDKLASARQLMSSVFKYHPSLLLRLRFALSKNLLSKSRLEWILEHA